MSLKRYEINEKREFIESNRGYGGVYLGSWVDATLTAKDAEIRGLRERVSYLQSFIQRLEFEHLSYLPNEQYRAHLSVWCGGYGSEEEGIAKVKAGLLAMSSDEALAPAAKEGV